MPVTQPLIAERYRLVRQLGEGGMGRVWLARDEVLHRDVAIKEIIPPPGLSSTEREEMRRRTLREARAAARLNHPNVVRVYDVVQTEPHQWIVMEYVRSRSLHQIISEDGPLPPRRAAEIGIDVLSALRAAHTAGVLHRDIKPGNVLLTEDGRVVLTDFGLATLEGEATVTRPGLILGSPAYIAPERARDGTGGTASDLWSLGATLYAAVEGQSPYARSSAMATLTALATEEPAPARHAGALRPVLDGLLRKDPTKRITAAEAERALRRAAGRLGSRWRSGLRTRPMPLPGTGRGTAGELAWPAGGGGPVSPVDGAPDVSGGTPAGGTPVGVGVPAAAGSAAAPPGAAPGDAATAVEPAAATAVQPAARAEPAESTLDRIGAAEAPPATVRGTAVVPAQPRTERDPLARRRRRLWIMAAAALLLVVALLVALAVTLGGDRAPSATGTERTATPSPGTSAATSAGTGANPSTGAQPPAGTPGPPAMPPGWQMYRDQTGFTVAAPIGWNVTRVSSRVEFRDPATRRVLIFDQRPDPQPDPVRDWQNNEAYRVARGDFPGYERIQIVAVDYFLACADWEFRYNSGGVRVHVINRGFVTSRTHAYGIYWSTPESTWAQNRQYFDLMTRTFQPAPGA